MAEHTQSPPPQLAAPPRRSSLKLFLNLLIVLVTAVVVYLSYAYLSRGSTPPEPAAQLHPTPGHVIQLDVLNGSGARGAAARVTSFLRSRGFDVVEMKNYKSSRIAQTLVVDRIGDLSNARRVAAALGVPEKRVIQQLNPDYFVDVSVVIGGDFSELQSSHER